MCETASNLKGFLASQPASVMENILLLSVEVASLNFLLLRVRCLPCGDLGAERRQGEKRILLNIISKRIYIYRLCWSCRAGGFKVTCIKLNISRRTLMCSSGRKKKKKKVGMWPCSLKSIRWRFFMLVFCFTRFHISLKVFASTERRSPRLWGLSTTAWRPASNNCARRWRNSTEWRLW